ncbi:MAG: flavin reductase family protein [Clostridia bacterium]
MNVKALYSLSYGVYILTTKDLERDTGCVVNSAMQITNAPETIAVSVNHDNYTNSCIQKSGIFALSILAESSSPKLIGTFGFKSGKDYDKIANSETTEVNGVRVITDASAYIICKVINSMETNTHTVFLGEIIDADELTGEKPMTYAYYHNVIKGKSPKNAPTYIAEIPKK